MKTNLRSNVSLMVVWLAAWPALGQQTATAPAVVASSSGVPSLINYSGELKDAEGKAITGITGVTFLLYNEEQGGAPLWLETQNLTPDKTGHYTVQLGASSANGLPADLFVGGEARWLAVQISNEPEQPRVALVAVPYAMKAVDAETVGGLPPSAFVLAAPKVTGATPANASSKASTSFSPPPPTSAVTTSGGTVTTLPLWTTATNIQSSVVRQIGSGSTAKIGINTSTPAATLDVKGPEIVRGTLTLPTTGTSMKVSGTIQAADGTFPLLMNSVSCCKSGNRMIWAHDPSFANWGVYYDDNVDNMNWRTGVGGEFLTADFPQQRVGVGTTAPTDQLSVVALSSSVKAISAVNNSSSVPTMRASNNTTTSGGAAFQADLPNLLTGAAFIGDTGCGPNFIGLQLGLSGMTADCLFYTLAGDDSSVTYLNGANGISFRVTGFPLAPVEVMRADTVNNGTVTIGTLDVTNSLTKPSGSFKIDHPLDPANKYLFHSFVESPDMKNIYDGVVALDENAEAIVTLPDWFGALNRDFRYQLTTIGGFAPVYIAEEIQNNRSKIAGGRPGIKVSWQVTGTRQDAFANAHRIQVEVEKAPADRGHYLHPELFGASETAKIGYVPPIYQAKPKHTKEESASGSQTADTHPASPILLPASRTTQPASPLRPTLRAPTLPPRPHELAPQN